VPGKDPAHLGGDIWTADAAIEIMRRDRWSGLFLTFGGIDKIAHMLGEQDGHGLQSVPSEYRLADVLRVADEQLGRLLATLDAQGLSSRTLVVVTSDHGGQKDDFYMGNNGSQSCCPFENSTAPVTPPYWVAHLNALAPGKLRTAYASTILNLWLADRSAAIEQAVTRGMKDIPGITEIYARRQTGGDYRYEQVHANLGSTSAKFQAWAKRHSAELMGTMAGPAGPDLVGLLGDGYGFGRIGDHGGAQELVQRIPLFIRVPGEAPARRSEPLRQMDLAPEITRILGLKPAPIATPPAR
jgi:arylsulfatase A-like enzyme